MSDDFSKMLAELNRLEMAAPNNGPEGFSSADLAAHLGVGPSRASGKIKAWCASGLVRFNGKQNRVNIIGITQPVPVYVIVKQADGSQ